MHIYIGRVDVYVFNANISKAIDVCDLIIHIFAIYSVPVELV